MVIRSSSQSYHQVGQRKLWEHLYPPDLPALTAWWGERADSAVKDAQETGYWHREETGDSFYTLQKNELKTKDLDVKPETTPPLEENLEEKAPWRWS